MEIVLTDKIIKEEWGWWIDNKVSAKLREMLALLEENGISPMNWDKNWMLANTGIESSGSSRYIDWDKVLDFSPNRVENALYRMEVNVKEYIERYQSERSVIHARQRNA